MYIHLEQSEARPLSHITLKINSQWIVDLFVKGKTINILGGSIGKYVALEYVKFS